MAKKQEPQNLDLRALYEVEITDKVLPDEPVVIAEPRAATAMHFDRRSEYRRGRKVFEQEPTLKHRRYLSGWEAKALGESGYKVKRVTAKAGEPQPEPTPEPMESPPITEPGPPEHAAKGGKKKGS